MVGSVANYEVAAIVAIFQAFAGKQQHLLIPSQSALRMSRLCRRDD